MKPGHSLKASVADVNGGRRGGSHAAASTKSAAGRSSHGQMRSAALVEVAKREAGPRCSSRPAEHGMAGERSRVRAANLPGELTSFGGGGAHAAFSRGVRLFAGCGNGQCWSERSTLAMGRKFHPCRRSASCGLRDEWRPRSTRSAERGRAKRRRGCGDRTWAGALRQPPCAFVVGSEVAPEPCPGHPSIGRLWEAMSQDAAFPKQRQQVQVLRRGRGRRSKPLPARNPTSSPLWRSPDQIGREIRTSFRRGA